MRLMQSPSCIVYLGTGKLNQPRATSKRPELEHLELTKMQEMDKLKSYFSRTFPMNFVHRLR